MSSPSHAARSGPKGNFQRIIDPMARGLPANVEVERFVLGSIQLNESVFPQVADVLCVEDFSLEKHRRIFARMKDLWERDEEHIDRITVANELMRRGQLESVDGLSYLVSLDEGMPERADLDGYLRIIKDKATLRKTAFTAQKVLNDCLLETAAPDEILSEHLIQVEELRAGCHVNGRGHIEDLPGVAAARDDLRFVRKPELPAGAVIGVTGDSGSGKSTLVTAWIRDAGRLGIPALVLDRENPRAIVIERLRRLGLEDGALLRWYGGWAGDVPAPGAASVLAWAKSCDPKPIVAVDSQVAFLEGDENDARIVRTFMAGPRRLADLGCTVVVIHHDGKAETARDFRGSSDFKAAVDQAFHVTNISSDGKLDRLNVRCYKSRLGLGGSIIYRYSNGCFVRDDRTEAPARSVADQLTALVRENPGIGAREFEEKAAKQNLGRQRARDFLANGILVGVIRRDNASRNRFRHYLQERT